MAATMRNRIQPIPLKIPSKIPQKELISRKKRMCVIMIFAFVRKGSLEWQFFIRPHKQPNMTEGAGQAPLVVQIYELRILTMTFHEHDFKINSKM